MTSTLPRARHEARALLLPTPFATTEPAEEPRREQEILAWLGLQHEDQLQLHQECTRDAQGVHVPGVATGPARGPLLHPLSDQELDEAEPSSSDWDRWVQNTQRAIPFESAGDLHKLWAALHETDCHRGMPGDAKYRDHQWLAHRTTAAALVHARWDGGEAALLFVHYGPVQSFIEAARRTSDLWLGSYLVSDLAFTAVQSVAEQCGPHAVVYPHLASIARYKYAHNRDADLVDECLRPCAPNRFVAVVPRARARAIAESLARAVADRWTKMAGSVRDWLDLGTQGFDGFDEQVAEHPVVDIVVQRWPSDTDALRSMLKEAGCEPRRYSNAGEGYADVFALGRSTLGALRMVIPAGPSDGDARAKCTQCGLREAMGPRSGRRNAQRAWWSNVREHVDGGGGGDTEQPTQKETVDLRSSEMLCAVCLTKRFAHRFDIAKELGLDWGEPDQRVKLRFPSVASIASAPFRSYLARTASHAAVNHWHGAVQQAHHRLGFTLPGNQVRGLGGLGRGEPLLEPDGTWLYARSYDIDTCLRDHDDPTADRGSLSECLEQGRTALAAISADRKASAYYAIVMLDVDDMGAWLDGSHPLFPKLGGAARPVSASLHADISRRQGVLATQRLHEVVEEHLGQLVYSGGDDVLAFLPLQNVSACLVALRERFTQTDALGRAVTLSAGVAVADWKAPLQGVLRRARRAESEAKQSPGGGGEAKNAVVIDLSTRSGMPMSVRLRWDELGALQTCVNDLWRNANDRESSSERSGVELLRPAALEVLRAEAPMLQSLDVKAPLQHRVSRLLGSRSFSPLERMLEDDGRGTMDRILDLLALVRFLVREHGGVPYGEVTTKETNE